MGVPAQQSATAISSGSGWASILTLALWSIGGLVFYYAIVSVQGLIHPIQHDIEQSHYINVDSSYIMRRRLLWVSFLVVSAVLGFLIVKIFFATIDAHLHEFILGKTIQPLAGYAVGVILVTLLCSALRLSIRAVRRLG
jgi:hypothetical protein